MQRSVLVMFAPVLFSGCSSSSYGICVAEGLPKETYLTFSKGSPVNVGDVFVGRVQVIKIADETHALVKTLSGIAEDDVQAEQIE